MRVDTLCRRGMKWDEKRAKALTNQMLCQLSYAGFVSGRNMPVHPLFVQPLRSDCVRNFSANLSSPVNPMQTDSKFAPSVRDGRIYIPER